MEPKQGWKLVISLIDIIALGVQMAPAVLSAYNNARNKINAIVDAGRNPTPTEHEELNKILNDLRAILQAPIEDPIPTIDGEA